MSGQRRQLPGHAAGEIAVSSTTSLWAAQGDPAWGLRKVIPPVAGNLPAKTAASKPAVGEIRVGGLFA